MAGLLDEEELLPVFSNPNIARQGARARALAAQRNVNTLPDPRTYAAVQGLLGTRPDEMGFSVLNPAYEDIRRVADPAFAVGTALGVAPAAGLIGRAAGRGAMAAGRAGERMAERVVPQVMERGGRGAGLLEALSARTVSPLTVYHGSPAKFEKFDASKIGTGEGAQAYGYGHYVAESPAVAKGYQKATSKNKFISGQGFFDPSQLEHLNVKAVTRRGDLDQAIAEARKYAAPDSDYPETAAKAARDLAKLEALKSSGGMRINEGALYTIDLPDSAIARMLDWDKKFSEQPENVQRGILKYWSENPGLKYYGRPEQMTGEGIYGSVKAASLGPEGGARINLNPANQAAAMDLRYQGIPGIRYLDQGSRGAGQGTSNFVVFPGEEGLLRILKRNEDPLGLFAP